ncbi:MAG: hypothetical protein KDB53_09995, partial [Planctomycetes bacterium]|nr:hypothetical protein [Planctomycetota bacterium]
MRNRILTILWALGVATATAPAQIVITGSQGASIVIRSSGGAITVGGAADKKEEAAEDVEEFQPLAEGFAAELDALLTRTPPDFAALQDLATRIQLEHGALEPAFRYLETKQAAAGSTDTLQSSAAWCLAIMRRSYGDLQAAQEQLYDLVSSETGRSDPRAWKEYAEVLDARGQLLPALSAYGQWLSLLENDAEAAAAVRLRIALIRKSEPEVVRRAESSPAFTELGIGLDGEPQPYVGDALARLARDSDIELRNRSAVVLAMLGDPGGAADLFEVTEEGSKRFRQELRLAEWNLQADRVADARDMAWRALESATLDRDRRFALALLVEAWRRDDQLEGLLAKLTTTPGLPEVARRLQVDILRELGRVDEAMELFRAHESSGFTVDMRRELLEMCREAGREEELVATYRDLVASEPDRLEWREGLSRYFLERGLRGEALQLWQPLLTRDLGATKLMDAADATMALGLDELAIAFAGEATKTENGLALGWLFLCNLHLNRGRMAEAEHALDALDREAEPDAAARMQLGEGYERLGNQLRAVDVLERLKEARGVEAAAEDLEMRLAWLYSETGQEKKALDAWRTLWARVESIPRLAYVEDRLLNVSSRLGTLADLAIELEERLDAGQGDTKDRGLLVRLYTKANDPVSAAEILTSYGRTTGDEVTTLSEMARVYLSCADFLNYERTVRQLIDVDPEGAPDYLRQLAMSALERARPDQARPYLRALKHLERGAESAEFEAGVLALAGMHSDAIRAYRKGMAVHPDRIEASLLLADVMNKTGQRDRALGMFQYLAETADKDDLFIVALDGLLNLRAEGPVLAWARRIVL